MIINIFSKEFIESIPKTINSNGCWIPLKIPNKSGYVYIGKYYSKYLLHRLALSVYHSVNYFDSKTETRHATNCNRACFNPEHLKPGSTSDNALDAVRDKTGANSKKTKCPLCGREYKTSIYRSGLNKGKKYRYCPNAKYH